jgi:predicted metal-binding membrane protein
MGVAAGAAALMPGAVRAARHRRAFVPILLGLVALAWLALWALGRSPWARFVAHGDWAASGPLADLCRALPAGGLVVPAAFSAGAWVLMTAAMMLPTTLPLFDAFDRLAAGRADHGRLLALLGLGYLATWGAFGVVAHAVHAGLLGLASNVPGLDAHAWAVGATLVALAGAFQFSRLKTACLEKCRTPLSFVIAHWRGPAPARQAFALGAHHGLHCVGCCWALMLLMFAVGAGSLGWMLALAAVMAMEKNLPWGRRLSAPLGVALLAGAAAVVAWHA